MKKVSCKPNEHSILEKIEEEMARLLKKPRESLEFKASFLELGIDSMLGVDLVEGLSKKLAIQLGPEVIFDHRGASELANHIAQTYEIETGNHEETLHDDVEMLKGKPAKEKVPPSASPVEDVSRNKEDIAIIGISGRFPDSENLEEYWTHLQKGHCCIREIRRHGWDDAGYNDPDVGKANNTASKWGGLLKDIDTFDPLFFNISPLEARRMDPQQRLFLEESYKAFEDSGYSMEQLSGKNVGVFVGARVMDYKEKILVQEGINSQAFLGNDMSILAARISYFLNLKGPNLAIDTACSSSLLAVHLACQSIKRKESEMALAGGVFIIPSPQFYLMAAKTEMMSLDGMCRTFDDGANGIVIGEGVGALVLKPLTTAIHDGDHIYGIIKGTGVNQDGSTQGITAPSSVSQIELIGSVYEKAGIHPETVSYIEAHGTGTKLGDPIEVKALTEAFRNFTAKKQFCALGSHKPNIGHTIMTAGIAGLFKILMALKYREIPPTINLQQPNRHIDFENSPFYVNTKLQPWKSQTGQPLRAGISSFGFSGTNCHLIIQEPPPLSKKKDEVRLPYYFIPLAARTDTALTCKLKDLAAWLDREDQLSSIADIGYTLQMGRSHFACRLALIVKDTRDLGQKIGEILEKGSTNDYVINRQPEAKEKTRLPQQHLIKEFGKQLIRELNDPDGLDLTTCKEKLLALADLYVDGYDLDWGRWYRKPGRQYHRISLPAYPFASEHYWIKEVSQPINDTGKDFKRQIEKNSSQTNHGRNFFYIPRWQPVNLSVTARDRDTKEMHVMIIYSTQGRHLALKLAEVHEQSAHRIMKLDMEKSGPMTDLSKEFPGIPEEIDLIYFLGGIQDKSIDMQDLEAPDHSQDLGVLSLFGLVKVLSKHGFAQQSLQLKVITNDVQIVETGKAEAVDRGNPYAASLQGLALSAAREFPRWEVTCIDISMEEGSISGHGLDALVRSILDEPAQNGGGSVALHSGKRYIQTIAPLILPPLVHSRFRHQGVYLISGGLGGIGLELSIHLAKTRQARLVLLDRFPPGDHQQKKIARIESCGGQVLFIQADITDQQGMREAVNRIKTRWGNINGVIHAATVVRDCPLEHMDESTFRAGLLPKVKGTVVLVNAISQEPLDFLLIFSSIASFLGNAGASNYVAGSVFQDLLCTHLDRQRPYPVKVINWGYWGKIGIGAAKGLHELFASQGIHPLGVEQGIDSVERILENRLHQVIALQAEQKLLDRLGVDPRQQVLVYKEYMPSTIETAISRDKQPLMDSSEKDRLERFHSQMETFYHLLLGDAFRRMGVFQREGEQYDRDMLKQKLNISSRFFHLFDVLLDILERAGIIRLEEQTLVTTAKLETADWQKELAALPETRDRLLACQDIQAHVKLLWTCLKQYPHILQGHTPATDIMFPNSSVEMVEDIYKGNPAADYYNQLVVWCLMSYIRIRLPQLQEGEKIKILEVGAGAGSTSALVLDALAVYDESVHYVYTDISPGFVKYGRTHYGPGYSFVEFKVLNIEEEPTAQGYIGGDFDVVIATNVLHATASLRNTLAKAKILLKTNGWLIINELTEVKDFISLTFGLLPGWWLYRDKQERLPGSPLAGVETWQQILREQGFEVVVLDSHARVSKAVRQHILVAGSNGTVRQDVPQPVSKPGTAPPSREYPGKTGCPLLRHRPQPSTIQEEKRRQYVEKKILESLTSTLQIPEEAFDMNAPYSDFGVDSILAIEIINRVNEGLGIRLKSTDLFNYSNISALVDYIQEEFADTMVFPIHPPAAVQQSQALAEVPGDFEKVSDDQAMEKELGDNRESGERQVPLEIAVIGISARFPGARNIEQFWENLAAGKSSIQEITRWDAEAFYDPNPQVPGRSCSRWGGFLEKVDEFDAHFFSISPREAELMDPQQRIFLEEAWKALEDAGCANRDLDGKKCGIFVGFNYSDYRRVIDQNYFTPEAYTFMGNAESLLASRISYTLNLRGPAVTVNTACSASLLGVHLACESIGSGSSDLALAGGISVLNTPDFYIMASSTGMLSPSGQCKTFDNRADGFVPGEGVGVVVLKELAAALEDGDHIYGIIAGLGINQDGKTNGITAPSAPSQTALECDVYERYHINPRTITYVETHGTGTRLGDPIEIDALSTAFKKYTSQKQYCAVGSVKTNIGHTLAASGIAGLIKVLLCLQHKTLVPSLNFEKENELIKFKETPFYVNTEQREWTPPEGIPRTAAVSSFGFSGTNAHVVVREMETTKYPNPQCPENLLENSTIKETKNTKPWYMIPISAKNEAALKQKLADLAEWLANHHQQYLLRDISYTLLMRRSHFQVRSALIARSIDQLAEDTGKILDNEDIDHYMTHTMKKERFKPEPALEQLGELLVKELKEKTFTEEIYKKKLLALADLYTKGYDLDWRVLYRGEECHCISLPIYPFARGRYWVESPLNGEVVPRVGINMKNLPGGSMGWLHPMVGANSSTFEEQRFTTPLTGHEFYMAQHVVVGKKTLPAVAYLEMVRAAGEIASGLKVRKIKNSLWAKPIMVESRPLKVHIHLRPVGELVDYEVSTANGDFRPTIHARGKLVPDHDSHIGGSNDRLDIAAIRERCRHSISGDQCYQRCQAAGLEYGPSFKPIRELWANEREALNHLQLPPEQRKRFREYVLHPSLMDGALQTVIALMGQPGKNTTYLPFALGEVEILRPLTERCYAYAQYQDTGNKQAPADDAVKQFDIQLTDETGLVLVRIKDFSARALVRQTDAASRQRSGKESVTASMYFLGTWETSPPGPGTCETIDAVLKSHMVLLDTDEQVWKSLKKRVPGLVLVKPGKGYREVNHGVYEINPGLQEDYHDLIRSLNQHGGFPSGIVYLWSKRVSGSGHQPLLSERGIFLLFNLTLALLRQRSGDNLHLLYVYGAEDSKTLPFHGAVSGFARSLYLENPSFVYKTVEIENMQGFNSDVLDMLMQEFITGVGRDFEIRYKNGQRWVRGMKEAEPPENRQGRLPLRKKGVYVITGGTGALGLLMAAYLVRKWNAQLVLTDIAEPGEEELKKIKALRESGSEVVFIKADISRRPQVETLILETRSKLGEINGIIHAAGVIRDAFIIKKTQEQIETVLAPKVWGTLWLDEVLEDTPLEVFVLFSSLAAVMGNLGQSDYAYANRFMDQFAEIRERLRASGKRRGKTLSINWPLWNEGGMKVDEQTLMWLEKKFGLEGLQTADGLEAFETALALSVPQVAVLVGEKAKVRDYFQVPVASHHPSPVTGTSSPFPLKEKVEHHLVKLCAEILKVNEKDIDPGEELGDYGLDSIMMMTLLNRLEEMYGTVVEPNALAQYRSINHLAAYLIEQGIVKASPEKEEKKEERASQGTRFDRHRFFPGPVPYVGARSRGTEKIAVIGMACRFPASHSLEVFWDNLQKGRNLVREIPPDRWDIHRYYSPDKTAPNKSYSRWGGFVDNIYYFDAGYFGIADEDALVMDPQHRILLELTEELFCRAGYTRLEVDNSRTGVFIGGGEGFYVKKETRGIPDIYLKHLLVNTIQNMMAARVSDFYNLRGPSHIIDTACSSALVALHQACQAIRAGECHMAIAGGTELLTNPYLHIAFSKAEVLSPDGVSYVFDERANGFVLGEGLGLVLLKPYEAALEDGDDIRSVILGSAVNNDGHTMGLTVPNLEGQKEVIREALACSGVSADNITYLETHGTGTLLGDPIEIRAATQVYRQFTREKQYCAVGSVKSNMGHLMRAAGMPSFIKVVLSLQNKMIPPTLHCTRPHPRFKFEESPFYPVRQPTPWQPRKGIRQAGVSSFGFGGTNCHMILEELNQARRYNPKRHTRPLPLFKRKRYCLGQEIPEENEGGDTISPGNVVTRTYTYDEPYLRNHQGNNPFDDHPDSQVLLGVTHCSLAIEAARLLFPEESAYHIHKLVIANPVVLYPGEMVDISVSATAVENHASTPGKIFFTLRYKKSVGQRYQEAASGEFVLGSTGRWEFAVPDIFNFRDQCKSWLSAEEIYDQKEAKRGALLKTLRKAWVRGTDILGELQLTQEVETSGYHYHIQPALLDGAFISSLSGLPAEISRRTDPTGAWIPFMVKDVYSCGPLPAACFCYSQVVKATSEVLTVDIHFINESQQVLLALKGFTYRYMRYESSLPGPSLEVNQAGQAYPIEPGEQISSSNLPELEKRIETYLANKLAAVLGENPKTFTPAKSKNKNFMDLGVDSHNLVIISREIEKELGIELYPTLFFEYQNIKELVAYFMEEHRDAFSRHLAGDKQKPYETILQGVRGSYGTCDASESASLPKKSSPLLSNSDVPNPPPIKSFCGGVQGGQFFQKAPPLAAGGRDIAVIGMAGRFAGSRNLEEFWENLKTGRDLITEIPLDHWDWRPWFDKNPEVPNKTYCKWGSFIEVDKFDPLFFGITPREAVWMDPQLRILLEVVCTAIEDAGYGRTVYGSNTGTFVGTCLHEYWDEIVRGNTPIVDYQANSVIMSSLSGRISYTFDLQGESVPVDNACASSLTAIHLACRALQAGECEMAVAAGVNVLLSPLHYVYSSRARALSPTGRCLTFDKAADGYVPGEGAAALLLKPLEKAAGDSDHIYAVIKGTAANHVGKSNNPTAPRPELQEKVLLKAWKNAGINPETITYIEAHGTGTELGDPVEINALKKAFKGFTNKKQFCAIGSAKAHIGHLEGAAGIAGVIKTILSMQHKQIPSMPFFNQLNPYIILEDSPFFINRELQPWTSRSNEPRRAGVSSFGITGNNVHVVLEEYIPSQEPGTLPITLSMPMIFVLSAADKERLKIYARNMAEFLEKSTVPHTGQSPAEENQFLLRLQDDLSEIAAAVTAVSKDEIKMDEDITEYAMDVHGMTECVKRINETYNLELRVDIFSGFSTLELLSRYLFREYRPIFSEYYSGRNQSTDAGHEGYADRYPPAVHLADLVYTLQMGRQIQEERLAIVVHTMEELKEKLQQYCQGQSNIQGLFQGNDEVGKEKLNILMEDDGPDKRDFVENLIRGKKYHKLAQLWVLGLDIDWEKLYRGHVPQRISLPTYPFARERYWIPETSGIPAKIGTAVPDTESEPEPGKNLTGDFFFIPRWKPEKLSPGQTVGTGTRSGKTTVLIVYSPSGMELKRTLTKAHAQDNVLEINLEHSTGFDSLHHRLAGLEFVYFLGGICDQDFGINPDADELALFRESQEQGVLSLFRLVKFLGSEGLAWQPLQFKVITNDVMQIACNVPVKPYSAALPGFIKTLAKEYPQWKVSGIDISLEEFNAARSNHSQPGKNRLVNLILEEPGILQGETAVFRGGQRFIRQIQPLRLPPQGRIPFKPGGVYMILGGAGKIGMQLNLYLARTFQARLVLLGRHQPDEDKKKKIEQLESLGGKAIYIQADVTNLESMKRAAVRAKSTFNRINGVIHSAMDVRSKALENLDEETFYKGLAPKVQGSVILYHVFKEEPLDFLLFFSSCQSFIGEAGMSSYVAGNYFEDTFAHCLDLGKDYPVRSVNWGYWQTPGEVLEEIVRRRIAENGLLPFTPEQGFEAIRRVLGSPVPQVLVMRAETRLRNSLGDDGQHDVQLLPSVQSSLFDTAIETARQPVMDNDEFLSLEKAHQVLMEFSHYLLLKAFQQEGVYQQAGENYNRESLKQQLNIIHGYHRLYNVLLDILERAGFIRINGDNIQTAAQLDTPGLRRRLKSLEQEREQLSRDFPMIKAAADLLWVCLEHYPQILQGKIPATDVIFPDSSMELLEAVYKGNVEVDYYNQLVCWSLISYIRARLPLLTGAEKIKILEIGAGTGGTSSSLFHAIGTYGEKVQYLYTDISMAFTRYGQQQYGNDNPFVEFKVLDIEKGAQEQGYEPGAWDVVIAANVLHATRYIRNTLANAKALLKTNGWLIINEATRLKDITSLIFGLLEGWWLYRDEENRLKGCPLMNTMMWERILKEEGFQKSIILGQPEINGKTGAQHVIIAESDGIITQKIPRATPVTQSTPVTLTLGQTVVKDQEIPAKEAGPPGEPAQYVEEKIIDILAVVLQVDRQKFTLESPYTDFGVDSILAIEIVNQLNKGLAIDLRSTDLFNYTTIKKLSQYIREKFGEVIDHQETGNNGMQEEVTRDEPQSQESIDMPGKIAIIGISGRFPDADNIDEFWQNLAGGKHSVREITRWDPAAFYDPDPEVADKSYSRWGGFLSTVDEFDSLFFNISPGEAEMMDPQQRLFLEESWKALEDAGYSDRDLEGKKCGVFVGFNGRDYHRIIEKSGLLPDAYQMTGNYEALLPARTSYFLNLRGPAITVNTACSASLVAVHLACESIYMETSELALAGGVSILGIPDWYILLCRTGVLSPGDRCRAFDDRANGIVPGEGIGVVLLKRLDQALEDGDHIYGVIIGSGINQDGKSNGITAPSAPSQTALECEIYDRNQIDPAKITYIEAHGTGTRLGDPIEIQALTDAFRKYTQGKQFCAVGTVKTNIGHSMAAAGIAGLIKVLLCLNYKKLVPTLNFEKENEMINFKDSPFYANTRFQDWKTKNGEPRLAAVSSFGFSGTNAHVVLREAPRGIRGHAPLSVEQTARTPHYYLIPISAKTPTALEQKWKDLGEWLDNQGDAHRLKDISYTLLNGRSHFVYRSLLVVENTCSSIDLAKKIQALLQGKEVEHYFTNISTADPGKRFKPDPNQLQQGETAIKELQETQHSRTRYKEKLQTLADLYIQRYDLDWHRLYAGQDCRRISLPTYPFAKQRCWIPGIKGSIRDNQAETYEETGTVGFTDEQILKILKRIESGELEVPQADQMLDVVLSQ